MNISLRSIVLALALLVSASAHATTVSVIYTVQNSGYTNLSGTFAGNDANNDGMLTFSELIGWTTGYDGGASLPALNDLGDFNYLSNVWIPNAFEWNQVTPDAYMTWNNWTYSMSTSSIPGEPWQVTTSVQSTNIPEPASLALLGLGLAGLAAIRRKKVV